MPQGVPARCDCGCGVTPTTYRSKFKSYWPSGYPYDNGLYYCSECSVGMPWSKELHIDHIIPKSDGGRNCIHNLRPMCAHCNQVKTDKYGDKEVTKKKMGKVNLAKKQQQKLANKFKL